MTFLDNLKIKNNLAIYDKLETMTYQRGKQKIRCKRHVQSALRGEQRSRGKMQSLMLPQSLVPC